MFHHDRQSLPSSSPLSVGLFWAQRITAASLQVIVLIIVGFWLDNQFGIKPWGTLGFAVLGMVSMFYNLLKIAREVGRQFQHPLNEDSFEDEN